MSVFGTGLSFTKNDSDVMYCCETTVLVLFAIIVSLNGKILVGWNEYTKLREEQTSELSLVLETADDWTTLDCIPSSNTLKNAPKSVRNLTPSDITVVGALGDSLTTAQGALATNWLQMSIDYRNVSFSTGGGPLSETISLANILQKFSPNLIGVSNQSMKSQAFLNMNAADYNCAIDGSESSSLEFQAKDLVDRIKQTDNEINTTWKLVTIFSGTNDRQRNILCSPTTENVFTPDRYYMEIKRALRILHKLPRILIVIITVEHLGILDELNNIDYCAQKNNLSCTVLNYNFKDFAHNYSALIIDLEKFDKQRQDFGVIVQPFPVEAFVVSKDGIPNLGIYTLDCFHWSGIGQSLFAKTLWHNILAKPVKNGNAIACPHPDCPYFIIGRSQCVKTYGWWIPVVATVFVLITIIIIIFVCDAFCKQRIRQRFPSRPEESTPLLGKS